MIPFDNSSLRKETQITTDEVYRGASPAVSSSSPDEPPPPAANAGKPVNHEQLPLLGGAQQGPVSPQNRELSWVKVFTILPIVGTIVGGLFALIGEAFAPGTLKRFVDFMLYKDSEPAADGKPPTADDLKDNDSIARHITSRARAIGITEESKSEGFIKGLVAAKESYGLSEENLYNAVWKEIKPAEPREHKPTHHVSPQQTAAPAAPPPQPKTREQTLEEDVLSGVSDTPTIAAIVRTCCDEDSPLPKTVGMNRDTWAYEVTFGNPADAAAFCANANAFFQKERPGEGLSATFSGKVVTLPSRASAPPPARIMTAPPPTTS